MENSKNKELTPEEKWERATLADNFIFYKVMRHHPDVCREVIELLLGIKIESLEMRGEEQIDLDHDSKGIRLDVYVKGENRMFDIELQLANTKELPERSRYYSALMSLDTLKAGEPYKALRDSHVIFICMEDIFGDGLPVYTFENICLENSGRKLNDRDYRHFFIAPICGKMIKNVNARSFFNFLISNKAGSELTERLRTCVEDAKHNMQWRFQYMTWERQQYYSYEEGREAGIAEGHTVGLSEGMAAGKIDAAVVLIKDFGVSPELAAEKMGVPLEDVLKLLGNLKGEN